MQSDNSGVIELKYTGPNDTPEGKEVYRARVEAAVLDMGFIKSPDSNEGPQILIPRQN